MRAAPARSGRLLWITLLLCAVCVAAFAAHWLIDVVGDFALPHDTYDDVGHGSRIGTVVGALAFLLLALFEFLNSVLGESLGGRVMVRSVARTVIRAPWRFGALVVALTVLAVIGMECVDGLAVGRVIDDPSDLFGGSVALGASLAAVAAVLVSLLVIAFAGVLGAQRDVIVRLLSVLVALPRHKCAAFLFDRGTRSVGRGRRASVYARRAAKRGPPILAA